MWKRIKNWWANLFTSKEKDQPYCSVTDKEDRKYLYEEDTNMVAMLEAVMKSGKPCLGTVDEEGNMTIKVIDE